MAATLDTTLKGETSNSYVDLTFAQARVDEYPSADAWAGATADEQTRSLIEATRVLDRLHWQGIRTSGIQALQWPRYGARNPDHGSDSGRTTLDAEVIPARVKRAQVRLAYAILSGEFGGSESGLDGLEELKVGSIALKPRQVKADALPDAVRSEIAPLLAGGGSGFRLVRG